MAKEKLFTSRVVDFINKMRGDINRLQKGPPTVEKEIHTYQASHTYVALTPAGGIPALSRNDTGTDSDDEPGFAECEIYRITNPAQSIGDTGTELMQALDDDFSKVVYNVADYAIEPNEWIVVTKCKNGAWVATTYTPPLTLIALTPPGGIAALDVQTSGTGDFDDDKPGSATCDIYYIDGDGEMADTGSSVTVYNVAEFAVDGDMWIIISKTEFGKWMVVYPQQPFDRCNAIVKGNPTGTATTITVDNVVATRGKSPVANASEELTVDNLFSWDPDDNDPCKIEYNHDDSTWEIYEPGPGEGGSGESQAQWLEFVVSADFLTGGMISIGARTYRDGDAPVVNITSILNPLDLTGEDTAKGIAIRNSDVEPPTYTAISIAPVAETVVTDFQVDTATLKLEIKTRNISIMPRGDESEFVVKHTGTDCT